MTDDAEATLQEPDLGQNLKRLRAKRGWNLNRLAAESGLPQSTLSKVENGRMSLNYEKIVLVANVLDVDVSELFATQSEVASRLKPMARRTIQLANEGETHVYEHMEYRHLCTELKNRLMGATLLKVHDRSRLSSEDQDLSVGLTHVAGERFAYVVSGEIEFISEQYQTTVLSAGDSLYIDAAMPHAFVAKDGQTAEILSVITSDDQNYLEFVRRAASKGLADATQAYEAYMKEFADKS